MSACHEYILDTYLRIWIPPGVNMDHKEGETL